jgi:hypothetical protein
MNPLVIVGVALLVWGLLSPDKEASPPTPEPESKPNKPNKPALHTVPAEIEHKQEASNE